MESGAGLTYQNDDGTEAEGYIPTSCLDLPETADEEEDTIDKDKDAGTLHESTWKGVFADALEDDGPECHRRKRSADRHADSSVFRRKSCRI